MIGLDLWSGQKVSDVDQGDLFDQGQKTTRRNRETVPNGGSIPKSLLNVGVVIRCLGEHLHPAKPPGRSWLRGLLISGRETNDWA